MCKFKFPCKFLRVPLHFSNSAGIELSINACKVVILVIFIKFGVIRIGLLNMPLCSSILYLRVARKKDISFSCKEDILDMFLSFPLLSFRGRSGIGRHNSPMTKTRYRRRPLPSGAYSGFRSGGGIFKT